MGINRDKPGRWKTDIIRSVDMYNRWFMEHAPEAFKGVRAKTATDVVEALAATKGLTAVTPKLLAGAPQILPALRMSTCPPLAVDRLIGLAGVDGNLVKSMDKLGRIPPKMKPTELNRQLARIGNTLSRLADRDFLVWLDRRKPATVAETDRAATVIADRLCGSLANPIVRNAQETRQLEKVAKWLRDRGYRRCLDRGAKFDSLKPGTFAVHVNVPAALEGTKKVTVSVDVAIQPSKTSRRVLPILLEAKSAGDYTNVNKRRKEEAQKHRQLLETYGRRVKYILLLCGYFDSGYLGYEASEGIDWVWEHRIDDLAKLGL
ncbi:XamI family restriction endonuclease [candidate division WOR-3 bacterium]|nr:XamI family restriction endonuclease [candidate division WOR-3 bacterium]